MIQNIILIVLIIILSFFMSNEKKINELISKKYIKYLFILLIIYFIYQNYNLSIFVLFLLVILFLNINIKEKFVNNKYLKQYENFKNLIVDYFNEKFTKEKFSNNNKNNNSYDFLPFVTDDNKNNSNNNKEENKEQNKIEPFKTEVLKLKDLYENIKLEINKLK
jgi:hypothetical protein